MSDNVKMLLVGTGYMGIEHCKVMKAQGLDPLVVGRSEEKCKKFKEETGIDTTPGGIEKYISDTKLLPKSAVVAVNVDQLSNSAVMLMQNGVKRILLEKPGGMSRSELERLKAEADANETKVFLAYNRRFYVSVREAVRLIQEDGGVSSFNFEFTEWSDSIVKLKHSDEIRNIWLLCNSSHVIDMAFFMGGYPRSMSTYHSGSLSWHKNGRSYAGAGETDKGILFSYQANWDAPGRWNVEILTAKRRFIFRPLEKLQVQERNSVQITPYELDDEIDTKYKPGLYKQMEAFVNEDNDSGLLSLDEYISHFWIYEKIAGIGETK